jgi:hypothetical protein
MPRSTVRSDDQIADRPSRLDCLSDPAYIKAAADNLPPGADNALDCLAGPWSESKYQAAMSFTAKVRTLALKQRDACVRAAYEFYADYYEKLAKAGFKSPNVSVDR